MLPPLYNRAARPRQTTGRPDTTMEQTLSGPEQARPPFAVLSVLLCVKADNDDWAFGKDVHGGSTLAPGFCWS